MFVEIKKASQSKLGFDWLSLDSEGKPMGGTGEFYGVGTTLMKRRNPMTGKELVFPSTLELYPNQNVNFSFLSNLNMTANLSLMNSHGYTRVLAKPKLICASGEKAKFLSGGQIPFIATNANGGSSITFKNYGVILDIEPIADSDGNIIVKIKSDVSDPDWSKTVQGYPTFINRKVETVVTIPSNNTIVLSGLFKFDEQKGVNKVAGLGHIPILGELFKSRNFLEGKSDLLVFVTPKIVTPDSNTVKNMIEKMKKNYEASSSEIGFSIFD